MNAESIAARLRPGAAFTAHVLVEDRVDSTNDRLKAMAESGASEGTVLMAREQVSGRGTHGRAFASPRGEGLYLSMLLRPQMEVASLLTLTGWAAVAVRRAIIRSSGAPVAIKWMNDIYLGGRKLCGILTELSPLGADGRVDWVVVGVGVNLTRGREAFRELGLEDVATSLAAEGFSVEAEELAACVIEEMDAMYRDFPHGGEEYLGEYREACLNVGRRVSFEERGRTLTGTARGVGEDFALEVLGEDGRLRQLAAGTVALL